MRLKEKESVALEDDNIVFQRVLFSHIKTKEEKEKYKETLKSALPVLMDIDRHILRLKEKQLETKDYDYDCPSWSHKQADKNGYIRALEDIRKLLPRPKGE